MSASRKSEEDVIVIGGGPAGAACSLWAHQLGLCTLLLESAHDIGGLQLRSPYVNRWMPGLEGRTGQEIATSLRSHLDGAGVRYVLNMKVMQIWQDADQCWNVSDNGRTTYRARHIVIATGAKPRRGNFVESQTVGIGPGMSMERLEVFGKRVAILGGGDNAFDQAIFALTRGARTVDIFSRSTPRALPGLREKARAAKLHTGHFVADQDLMTVNGEAFQIFGVQFGFEACVPTGLALPRRGGYIEVDRDGKVPGIHGMYAAGEVTNFWHPCVTTSYAHGVQVAKAINQTVLAASAQAYTAA